MKIALKVALTCALLATPAAALAQAAPVAKPAAAPAPAFYTTEESTIGDLLDNPATKAILIKHVKQLAESPQIDQARGMTLKAIQPYNPDGLTDDMLAAIDKELALVPEPKG